jgi:hypothetical protein
MFRVIQVDALGQFPALAEVEAGAIPPVTRRRRHAGRAGGRRSKGGRREQAIPEFHADDAAGGVDSDRRQAVPLPAVAGPVAPDPQPRHRDGQQQGQKGHGVEQAAEHQQCNRARRRNIPVVLRLYQGFTPSPLAGEGWDEG